MHTLAATVTVSGIDGFFLIVAALLFLVAAIVAWFVAPGRNYWAAAVACGLLLWVLTGIVK
jgi:hypothetical protein